MDLSLTSGLETTISQDSINNYIKLAHTHLLKSNSTINVKEAGANENGKPIFGICIEWDNGQEEWYDPYKLGKNTIAGWENEQEAKEILINQVIPNLGYAIHQLKLKLFHQNM